MRDPAWAVAASEVEMHAGLCPRSREVGSTGDPWVPTLPPPPSQGASRSPVTAGPAAGHRAAQRGRGVCVQHLRCPAARLGRLRQRDGVRLHPADHPQPGPALEEHMRHVHGAAHEVSAELPLKKNWMEGGGREGVHPKSVHPPELNKQLCFVPFRGCWQRRLSRCRLR